MAKNSPVTGPYPDGDSRNITLTRSDNPMEPPRSGPAEARYREGVAREDDARQSDQSDKGNKRAPRYEEPEEQTSAAATAFDRPTGDLEAPVLEKDWNPAERNSDDLSR